MNPTLLDRVSGSLLGGAIGDALGAPVEGWHWEDIRAQHGKLEQFRPFDCGYARGAGHVTDDSYLRHLLCLSIVERGGRVTPDEFAATLAAKMNPARLWVNETLALHKIRQRMNPWWETGRGNIPAGCATMAIPPVGIVNAGDPRQAYQDAFCIASVNQDGNNRDFAACFAAGIAAAFRPGAAEESVIAACFDHSDDLSRRALRWSLELAGQSATVDEFADRFYRSPLLDWSWPQHRWTPRDHFCGNSIEFVPVVPAILRLCAGDPNRAIIEGANFGRDCDTIGSCVGSVVGILYGAGALREAWKNEVEAANADIFLELHGDASQGFRAMAEKLHAVLGRRLAEQRAQCAALADLLA
jgi:ADP-ribosylglycohydrolase